jgi:thymidylate kinase
MDYVVGYWLIVRPQMVRTSLVTFDRYYPDVQADSMRLNSHRFRRMADLIERLIPLPDLIFVLDAPTETLRARQRDMSFEESTRQRNAYKKLAFVLGKRTRTVSIDTSRPSEVCVQEAMNEILRFLELRTRRRCRIAE